MRGKGELVLTGQLGDVMKESARAAWTYARSHAAGLQIQDEMFDRDIHIHVPAGAIPKDGPSAGVTMASAVVSALSGRPVRHDIAMTGEITLRGRVLPIGGVKEKVLGAVRAGITRIILPKENEPDLEDLPKEVRDKIEVHLVQELGEVLALTLRGATVPRGSPAVRRREEPAGRDAAVDGVPALTAWKAEREREGGASKVRVLPLPLSPFPYSRSFAASPTISSSLVTAASSRGASDGDGPARSHCSASRATVLMAGKPYEPPEPASRWK